MTTLFTLEAKLMFRACPRRQARAKVAGQDRHRHLQQGVAYARRGRQRLAAATQDAPISCM